MKLGQCSRHKIELNEVRFAADALNRFGVQLDETTLKKIVDGPREWKVLQKKLFAK